MIDQVDWVLCKYEELVENGQSGVVELTLVVATQRIKVNQGAQVYVDTNNLQEMVNQG